MALQTGGRREVPGGIWRDGPLDERAVGRLSRIVRVAVGRLGCVLSPWLDEGLMIGHGLATLMEAAQYPVEAPGFEPAALRWVVGGLRQWARASSWYSAAWPCRIAPLCAALAERGEGADEPVAADLGLSPADLPERYVEAGLLFGVSPELMLSPAGAGGADAIGAAVSALPPQPRRLLRLYFQEALSLPEIAEVLEMPPRRAQELYGRSAAAVRAAVHGVGAGE